MSHDAPLRLPLVQVSANARRDLKEGLVLYNTESNAGLRDAWNAIQGEVHYQRRKITLNPCKVFMYSHIYPPPPPLVAMLWRDQPQRLVRRAARQRGPRPLLPAGFPGMRTQRLQHLLDAGQCAHEAVMLTLSSGCYHSDVCLLFIKLQNIYIYVYCIKYMYYIIYILCKICKYILYNTYIE